MLADRTPERTHQPGTPQTKRPRSDDNLGRQLIKEIRCSVHGTIKCEPLLESVMNSDVFQRLRRLKQLGVTEHVYPSAMSSRFEHSLGVSHLAGEMCRRLMLRDIPKGAARASERDILCVKLAGLLHDIGHGPFSHTFEKLVPDFKHEAMSVSLVQLLFGTKDDTRSELRLSSYEAGGEHLDDENDLLFVEELIRGVDNPEGCKGRGRDKFYLYNIIANKAYGLDVDRLDYLIRDNKSAIGQDASFSIDFILDNVAVRMTSSQNNLGAPYPVIAFSRKAAGEVWKVFQSRYEMFGKVYLHEKGMGRELLLADLLEAMGKLPAPACHVIAGKTLEEAAKAPEDFILLDDHIVTRLALRLEDLTQQPTEEHTVAVRRARTLLDRYRRHSHYAKVAEAIVPDAQLLDKDKRRMKPRDIEQRLKENWGLDPMRFIVTMRVVHHGEGDLNPMAKMPFFNQKTDGVDELATPLKDFQWRYIPLPQHFERPSVCVFFRGDDDVCRDEAIKAAKQEVEQRWRKVNFPIPSEVSDDDDEQMRCSQGM